MVPVDVDPLLAVCLAVPDDGEEVSTFMNSDLKHTAQILFHVNVNMIF